MLRQDTSVSCAQQMVRVLSAGDSGPPPPPNKPADDPLHICTCRFHTYHHAVYQRPLPCNLLTWTAQVKVYTPKHQLPPPAFLLPRSGVRSDYTVCTNKRPCVCSTRYSARTLKNLHPSQLANLPTVTMTKRRVIIPSSQLLLATAHDRTIKPCHMLLLVCRVNPSLQHESRFRRLPVSRSGSLT